jgi:serine/threonine protein phosphatase PrpC/CRP-like cAMP-binding protein
VADTGQISAWALTNVGRVRDHNEDAFLVDEDLGLFAVADGMGGHAAGEVASQLALETFRNFIATHGDRVAGVRNDANDREARRQALRLMEDAAQAACAAVFQAGRDDETKRGMGTTLCAILAVGNHAFIAHVGDSRIYLVRDDKTHQLTQDHSLQNELLKRGRLSAEEIDRVKQKNALTRAIGVYESVEVDTLDLDIIAGDKLVLCSDGLSGYLRKGELTSILEGPAEKAPQRLVALANQRGGQDNITVLVLAAPEGGAAAARTELAKLKIETLQAVPLFRYLNYQELMKVSGLIDMRHFVADEVIVEEGQTGEELFIVLTGRVRVHKDVQTLVEFGEGEHFGEMALIDREPRSATVTATEDTRLLAMQRSDFFHVIKHERDLAVKLLWQFLGVLTSRLRTTSRELGAARGQDRTIELLDLDELESAEEPESGELDLEELDFEDEA